MDSRPHAYDVIIVGAGLSGAVCAERFANVSKKNVLIIDKRDHIGGNCYDEVDEDTGLIVSKYGPHFFHTNDNEVWQYVNRFSEWDRYDHRGVAFVDDETTGKIVTLPVNMNTMNVVHGLHLTCEEEMKEVLQSKTVSYGEGPTNGEESCLARFGEEIYEKIFKPYTTKQWNRDPKDLDASILQRIPLRYNFDDRYFADKYQAMPANGYTKVFENILKSSRITVRLNTDYFSPDFEETAPITIFTGPIDQFFSDCGLEKLEYRSLRFEVKKHIDQSGYVQTHTVVNYPALSFPHTRITEYKHVFRNAQRSPNHSVTVAEYPSDTGPEYYPVVNPRNLKLYEQYRELAKSAEDTKGVYFLGRLASFKYINMDQAIGNALAFFKEKFASHTYTETIKQQPTCVTAQHE